MLASIEKWDGESAGGLIAVRPCPCREPHLRRRVVLTGGPGAGKTAVLALIRQAFCEHVLVLPETAGILFGGGFPRGKAPELLRPAQRAIFFTQRELEATTEGANPALVLCDRGTVDAAAYWPGPESFWSAVGVALDEQLRRYDAVIHLRTPRPAAGYDYSNPLRIESAEEAAAIDERILQAWELHPKRSVVEAAPDFMAKAARALEILRSELPDCCRRQVLPTTADHSR